MNNTFLHNAFGWIKDKLITINIYLDLVLLRKKKLDEINIISYEVEIESIV